MSFTIALSGVNAAQKDLDVTANNIANVNTIGFKESRAEFADVYANSIFANTKTQSGSGVQTAAVAQQFHQGALQFTNNSLDMAINGSGFFVMSNELGSLDRTYSRAGAFKLNDQGFVVNSQGNYLQVFEANSDGTPAGLALNSTQALRIPERVGAPQMTENVNLSINLPAGAEEPTAAFSRGDSDTYNASTSSTVYDSLGEAHTLTKYFIKTDTNEWQVQVFVDDETVATATETLTFDTSGNVTAPLPTELTTAALGFTNGSDPAQAVTVQFDEITLFSSPFEVSAIEQDGSTVGRLTKVDVGTDGAVRATYSNGTTETLGIVAMARFSNEQGLTQIGDTQWRESQLSGEAVAGQPNTGVLGKISVASLEQSNTNLTGELVDLITAQRNFQANSRALEVNSTLQQTILQIR
ncbi:flagellar hook protein FlgE [Zobellella endophytica]|uniref:Flagellar hook protein FlgE n=1 Tax=Zobellella endophytica TaxID=2116700 RepID=A0A2P7R7T3_9GAMM|nr:flagellar hook protein FlgE [Zobellella endophytica]PSJ46284.1 flagellar hook protein FlgE [Zobellella endophytica]